MTDALDALKRHVGSRQTAADTVSATAIARLAATLDVDNPAPRVGDPIPAGWHTVLFGPITPTAALRPDGQVSGGGLSPPVPLPRRRLLGDSWTFHRPLHVGAAVTRTGELAELDIERAPTGPVVHELLRHTIADDGGTAVIEERRFVYLGEGVEFGDEDTDGGTALPPPVWRRAVEPAPTLMFRYSALRFNAHRVHYDRDYATGVEGCPGLLVPGSMIALMLLERCRFDAPDRPVVSFGYRSLLPVFDTGPFTLYGGPADGAAVALWAEDAEGRLAMTATARLGG